MDVKVYVMASREKKAERVDLRPPDHATIVGTWRSTETEEAVRRRHELMIRGRDVDHDIRTPLQGVVIGSMLVPRLARMSDEEQRRIKEGADRLNSTVTEGLAEYMAAIPTERLDVEGYRSLGPDRKAVIYGACQRLAGRLGKATPMLEAVREDVMSVKPGETEMEVQVRSSQSQFANACEHMKRMIDDYGRLYRGESLEHPHVPVNVNQMLRGFETGNLIGEGTALWSPRHLGYPQQAMISSEFAYGDVRPPSGDRIELEEALSNLARNSRDSLGERLHHERRAGSDWQPRIRVETRQAEGMTEIRFSDNGVGIDPARGDSIFESGETTKKEGSHQGAGLDITRRIIEGHGGSITYESSGRFTAGDVNSGGATFIIRLPS
ncbi:MAG: hypothetical protein GF416_05155 [Candidatus Altiarchaeales archaeon]|nr:hypothetical protein [Candidatus Altiarchaeales archaeon]MBD3416504.1 hypothetical protein [Candidatus Altiarchaeales archaeon]